MPAIPAPELIGDDVSGTLYRDDTGILLALGDHPAPPNMERMRPPGPLVIRYALPYLYRETAIVPGLFASEYGEMMVGQAAWDYVQKHFTMHPRADLLGIRTTDGQQDQVMIREIDFGRDVEVYAYADREAVQPLAVLYGFYAAEGITPPAMLSRYLPRLDHLPPRTP